MSDCFKRLKFLGGTMVATARRTKIYEENLSKLYFIKQKMKSELTVVLCMKNYHKKICNYCNVNFSKNYVCLNSILSIRAVRWNMDMFV